MSRKKIIAGIFGFIITVAGATTITINANNYTSITDDNIYVCLADDIHSEKFNFRDPSFSVYFTDPENDTTVKLDESDYSSKVFYTSDDVAVKIEGKNKYIGFASKIIDTDLIDINDCLISLSYDEVEYNGKAKYPLVQIRYNDVLLSNSTDYSIEYIDNTDVGEAQIIIQGQGLFSNSCTITFTITDQSEISSDNDKQNTQIITNQEDSSDLDESNFNDTDDDNANNTNSETQDDNSIDIDDTPSASDDENNNSPQTENLGSDDDSSLLETVNQTDDDIEISENINLSLSSNLTNITAQYTLDDDYDYIKIECSKYQDFSNCSTIQVSGSEQSGNVKFSDLDNGYKYYVRVTGYKNNEQTGCSNTERSIVYGMYNVSSDAAAYHTETHQSMNINIRNGYYCGFYDDDNPDYYTVIASYDYFAISCDSATPEFNGIVLPTGAISQLGEGVQRETACCTTCCMMIMKYEFGVDITKEQSYLDAKNLGYVDSRYRGMFLCTADEFIETELAKYGINESFTDYMGNMNSYDEIKSYLDQSLDNGHRNIITVLNNSYYSNGRMTSSYLSIGINHAVLIVGYVSDNTGEYYYVADPYYKESSAKTNYYYGLRKVSCSTIINSFISCYANNSCDHQYIITVGSEGNLHNAPY